MRYEEILEVSVVVGVVVIKEIVGVRSE